MQMKPDTTMKDIDIEWMNLILEAKKLGLSLDEVRAYLRQSSCIEKNK